MKKKTIAAAALFVGSAALLIAFAVKTAREWDYYTHTVNSAPFSLCVIVNALCFIVPAAILAVAALFLLKNKRALWIMCGVFAAAAAAVVILCAVKPRQTFVVKPGTPVSIPVETYKEDNISSEICHFFQENG